MSDDAPKRGRGRPVVLTQAIADEICERLALGESLLAICQDDHIPGESTVRGWVVDDREGFAAKYARSRDIGLDMRADRMEQKFMSEPDTQRARLLFDHDRWYLSKLAPKRYGDKVALTGGSETDAPIKSELVIKFV